jgi:flagellar basal-body rod modification protein FlgD
MSNITGVNQPTSITPAENKRGILGKDDFLKILITQLQNQDPMQPLQDREFIAQMAQFSSVEQLTNISQYQKLTFETIAGLSSSVGLLSGSIGKEIEWINGNGEIQSGVVEAIRLKQGAAFAEVAGTEIPLDQIVRMGLQK